MVDYWLLANLLSLALLLAVVFILVKSLLTIVNAYVYQINFYALSPHRDENVRVDQQCEAILANDFIQIRDKMIFRIVFSTAVLLGIIYVRYVLEVVHAAV